MTEQVQLPNRSGEAPPARDRARPSASGRAARVARRYRVELVIALAIVVIEVVLGTVKPAALTSGNLTNIAQAAAPLVILAFGELLVIITGGIDLSIGSIFSLTGVVTAAAIPSHGVVGAVLIGLAVGAGTGLFNGFCVGVLDLAPFIVTLITFSVDASLAFVVANGSSKPVTSSAFAGIDGAHLGPVPIYIVYVVVLLVVFELAFLRLTFGRWLFAVGSNERAARLLGIPTRSVKVAAYTLSGLLAAFAAILSIAYLQDAEVTAGNGLELQAIAAVVIGGASLSGGIGSAFSALVGAVLVTVIQNAVDLLGINSFYNGTVTGVVILLAVLLERVTRERGIRQQSMLRRFTSRGGSASETGLHASSEQRRPKRVRSLGVVAAICVAAAIVTLGVLAARRANSSSGGAGGAAKSVKGMTVAYLAPSLDISYWQWVYAGVREEAAKLGMKTVEYNANDDPAQQITNAHTAITDGVNALSIGPVSSTSTPPVLAAAKHGNTPISFGGIGPDPGLNDYTSSITADNFTTGVQEGNFVCIQAKKLGGDKVGMLSLPQDRENAQKYLQGAEQAFKASGCDLVQILQTHGLTVGEAVQQANDLLTAHPDIKGIYGMYDEAGTGAAKALEVRHLVGKVAVATADGSPTTVALLQKGAIQGLFLQEAVGQGIDTVEQDASALQRKPVQKNIPLKEPLVTTQNLCSAASQSVLRLTYPPSAGSYGHC